MGRLFEKLTRWYYKDLLEDVDQIRLSVAVKLAEAHKAPTIPALPYTERKSSLGLVIRPLS